MLDSFRRHTNGSFGFTLEQQKRILRMYQQDSDLADIGGLLADIYIERKLKHMQYAEQINIARYLISEGADVNAEMTTPLPGYTPLMLAAELDLNDLFSVMLMNGGDPKQTYRHSLFGDMDCWAIARYFNSKRVLNILEDILPVLEST